MGSCIRMTHSCLQNIPNMIQHVSKTYNAFTIYAAKAHPGSAKESEWVTPKIMNLHPDWRTFSTYSYISISITSSIHHHSMHIWVSHCSGLKNPGLTSTLGQSPHGQRKTFQIPCALAVQMYTMLLPLTCITGTSTMCTICMFDYIYIYFFFINSYVYV